MKRGRNQRRRPGGGNPNRALDSNGPDVRIRGTANQIYDKYLALARDASSSGDRVKAESYLQHAEHYFRLIRSMQPAQLPNQQSGGNDIDSDQPGLDDGDDNGRRDTRPTPREERNNRAPAAAPEAKSEEQSDEPAAATEAKASEAKANEAPAPEVKANEAKAGEARAGEPEEEKKPRRRRQPRKAVKKDDSSTEEATPATAAAAE